MLFLMAAYHLPSLIFEPFVKIKVFGVSGKRLEDGFSGAGNGEV